MSLPRPTDSELEILSVLWERGPCTVRDVADVLAESRGAGYTTVLKLMQIMSGKGLLERQDDQRAHIYTAAHPQEKMRQSLLRDFVERAFGGSSMELLQTAISGPLTTPEERRQLRKLIKKENDK